MRTNCTNRAALALFAWLLTAGLAAADAAANAVEPYSGRGLVFNSEGTLFFEAEEGGVYLLEGMNLEDYEGAVIIVTGGISDSTQAQPVLFVNTVAEDDANATSDAPRPEIGSGHL